jgi:branched-chain amino acid transport system permease protein
MVQYIVAGLVVGSVYAIASTGLVLTYRSAGILNFGFGGLAFFLALFFYYLNTDHGWPIWAAALVTICGVAPALGVVLYLLLFRQLRVAPSLIKIVSTIGLGVALPPLAYLILGVPASGVAPGLAPEPVASYRVFGVPITLNQIIVVVCLLLVLSVGFLVLRFTDVGLLVRATVNSPALTSLTGSNPSAVSLGVAATTTVLAALSGVLLAPIVTLDPVQFNLLIASAFTAVLIAKMSNIGRAVLVSIFLGLVSSVVEYLLPPTSPITSGVVAATPFVFVLAFLLWEIRRSDVTEDSSVIGKLDQAITPMNASGGAGSKYGPLVLRLHYPDQARRVLNGRTAGGVVGIAIVALLPLVLSDFWIAQVAAGLCFAVIFLSFTLVTGEGGMIWLCQAAFAGLGAILTAQLATHHGVPVLLALVLAALIVAPIGLIIGFLTTRLGDLYVVLATLAFGVLVDNVVFVLPVFSGVNQGGVPLGSPVAPGSTSFIFLVLGIFCVIALLIEHYRRSTAGLAMVAVRWSTRGAKSSGVSVTQSKVLVATVASFVAALGGGLLAMNQGFAVPSAFTTTTGLVWLAVLASVGIRSNIAALAAGLLYALSPALFQTYLPLSWAQVPAAAFGLGAIMLVRNPDGAVAMNVRQFRGLVASLTHRLSSPAVEQPATPSPEVASGYQEPLSGEAQRVG